jgi:hypothetical protein
MHCTAGKAKMELQEIESIMEEIAARGYILYTIHYTL